jgi:hypothetical protein
VQDRGNMLRELHEPPSYRPHRRRLLTFAVLVALMPVPAVAGMYGVAQLQQLLYPEPGLPEWMRDRLYLPVQHGFLLGDGQLPRGYEFRHLLRDDRELPDGSQCSSTATSVRCANITRYYPSTCPR